MLMITILSHQNTGFEVIEPCHLKAVHSPFAQSMLHDVHQGLGQKRTESRDHVHASKN